MASKAKKPKKSSEEKARERIQARQLDQEIGESEQRLKALARNKLGAKSLLAGSGVADKMVDTAAPKGLYGATKKNNSKSKIKKTA